MICNEIRTYLKNRNMEKPGSYFVVSPTTISLHPQQNNFQFSIKNIGNRSCHYQIFLPSCSHYKLAGNRTFSLAPGISRTVKVAHIPSELCSSVQEAIEVVDGWGNRKELLISCFAQAAQQGEKLEMAQEVRLQNLKVYEQKKAEITIKNLSTVNLKIKVLKLYSGCENKIQLKLEEDNFVLLSNTSKALKLAIKMLVQTELEVTLQLQSIQQGTKHTQHRSIKIACSSLLKSQFVADSQMNRTDTFQHMILNGTIAKGSLFLVNKYHQPCPFIIREVLQVQNSQLFSQRVSELVFKLAKKEGTLEARSKLQIDYEICTSLSENDRGFISRYQQLSVKDQTNAYKLRNSKHFIKEVEVMLKIQFGSDHSYNCRIKNRIINPALRISKSSSPYSEHFSIMNDSGCQVPFKIANHLYYSPKPEKGVLQIGLNSVEAAWKNQEFPFNSEENPATINRCCIKMEIPQMELILNEISPLLKRPNSAIMKEQSRLVLSREVLKERISARAPVKRGEPGVKRFIQVTFRDIFQKENKFIKHQVLNQDELCYFQINQDEKGFVLTNAHPSKNIQVRILDKGFLLMESCCSYAIAYDKKVLRVEHNGKTFELKPKELNDKQPYKLKSKELLFCFSQSQKEFEVVKQVQIMNRSKDILMMYCLSVEDEYFHSMQTDHKIIIQPNSTQTYKISLRPDSEQYLKEGKVTRELQFMINESKETITCEGDLLPALISSEVKQLVFDQCPYAGEVNKTFLLTNKGLSKVAYRVQTSPYIKISPTSGLIPEKGKQALTLSFRPSELAKNYAESILIQFKGSHFLTIPFEVNTLEPDIYCEQTVINFQEGYISQTLTSSIIIVNNNPYACNIILRLTGTAMQARQEEVIEPKSSKAIEIRLLVEEVGEKAFKLPQNFIELSGYGAIKGPSQYRVVGKKTVLQVIPECPLKDLVCSKHNQTKSFRIKNIAQNSSTVRVVLAPKSPQNSLILSCEPSSARINPGEQQEYRIHSIRTDESEGQNHSLKQLPFNLSIYFNEKELYRSIDFTVVLPPPRLEIQPQEVYFPLACVGAWSKSVFTVCNRGYKQVFIAVKKPTNISFQFDVQIEGHDNRLTKLRDKAQVKLLYKSKQPISFVVVLEVQNNYGQKYEVKAYGTTSRSPLLKCDRSTTSQTSFSSKDIKSSCSSLKSISQLDCQSEEHENLIFFNKWINGIFPESSKNGQHFYQWLNHPHNLYSLLNYIKSGVIIQQTHEYTFGYILEQLRKLGYPVYTIQQRLLKEGNSTEWMRLLWFILSKDTVKEDCLSWVSKLCGMRLQSYDSAFSHHKKVLIDLLSKLLEPIFKSKLSDWQKITDIFQFSFPVITKIQNKRQFVLLLNLLYNKFKAIETHRVKASNCCYRLQLPKPTGCQSPCWILANNAFEAELPDNCTNEKYLPEKKLLTFLMEGQATVNIQLKEAICLAVWTNTFEDPIRIYFLGLTKKAPIEHEIVIQCQDQCQQEWRLNFPCEVESEYCFEFEGGDEFRCKMPQVGVIKAGDVLQFTVIYAPLNLRDHQAVLTISNKFEEHIYSLKGKPLRTSQIQAEKVINVRQGQRCIENFFMPEDPLFSTSLGYSVNELESKTEQLKHMEARSDKKEIVVTLAFQWQRLVRNYQIVLQVSNKQLSFSRNIRLIINVIPRPIIIQAQIKGSIEKPIHERIPVNNLLNSKQNCFISIHSLSKQQFDEFSHSELQSQLQYIASQGEEEGQFRLNPTGKVSLKAKECLKVQLSYYPRLMSESCCQVRLRFQGTQQLIIYNYLGVPEIPKVENRAIELECEVEKETKRSIKLSNRLKQKVKFQVQTNLAFIAGPQEITLLPKEHTTYTFKALPLHAAHYEGKLLFKNQKMCLLYPLSIKVVNKKQVEAIKVKSQIRVSANISIQLANKSEQDVQYQVNCDREALDFPSRITIAAHSQQTLMLKYTPLFEGKRSTYLSLYNQFSNEITYELQMLSQPHFQELMLLCQLGKPKQFTIPIKNPTNLKAFLYEPQLPEFVSFKGHSHKFPLVLEPNSITPLSFQYSPTRLTEIFEGDLEFKTDAIGAFHYHLFLQTEKICKMSQTIIKYGLTGEPEGREILRQCHLQLQNPFDQMLNLKVESNIIKYNQFATIGVEGVDSIQLKPYQKRRFKVRALIHAHQHQDLAALGKREIVFISNSSKWIYPLTLTQLKSIHIPIQINGSSHDLLTTKVTLKHIRALGRWEVADFPDFDRQMNINLLSSSDLSLQAIINKPIEYNGSITFFQDDMALAEIYPLRIKIGGKQMKKIPIEANVGQQGLAKIKIKNGRGKFKAILSNNRWKQFRVFPQEGVFSQNDDNVFTFEYSPIEYNGSKKAEVRIESEGAHFDFCLVGKFPKGKPL